MGALDAKVLVAYVEAYHRRYRDVLERYFPKLTGLLALYGKYPYESTVIRSSPFIRLFSAPC